MSVMKTCGIVAILVALSHPVSGGQDQLAAARDLYASASYEEALTTLTRLAEGAPPDIARQVHQYRAFSLFALGRTAEAEQAAEAWIRLNPLVALLEGEVSPRIESMVAAVRRRVLPAMIREEYLDARTWIDKKNLKEAEPHLVLASRMIAEVRSTGPIDGTLSDLSLVVDGFLGLARATAPPPPAQVQVAAAPAVNTGAVDTATTPTPPAPPAAAPATAKPQIHSGPATNRLVLPVTVSQLAPEVPRNISELMKGAARRSLVLSLVINERGDVEDVSVVEPLQAVYDTLVMRAARRWKYRPATLDGIPVKFRKAVSVDFSEK